ncbi:ran/spi1 binding protein [Coprinopsis cinerea AmutBmut pab1-1]|nr:ran/spi1 binding protein [Coprinopsis cinerea AmutBmut pab1-1]
MKRVADKQLIREEADVEETNDTGEPGTGFRKADEAVLATRKIRALPKRAAGGSFNAAATPSAAAATNAPPKFGGFAGFGAPSSATSSFTFSSPAPASTSFDATPKPPPATSTPSTSITASNGPSSTAKTFAGFLSTPSTNGTAETKTNLFPTAPPKSTGAESNNSSVDYYSSLRGLNVSVLDAIKKYVDEDPFTDLSELLEQYKKLRLDVQNKFDSAKSASTSGAASPSTSQTKPAELPKFSMPTPPSTFAGFGGSSSTSANSTTKSEKPATGGFTPSGLSMPAPPSSFAGFGSFPKPSETKESTSSAAPATRSPFGSTSLFGGTDASKSSTPTAPSSGPFSFPSTTPSSGGSLFGNKDSSSPFGSSGTSSAPSSLPFSFAKPSEAGGKDAPIASLPFQLAPSTSSKEPPKSVFGSLAKEGEKEDEKESDKTASSTPFTFGAMSTSGSTSSPFGSFGTSFGKPASGGTTGFTFGSSSSTTTTPSLGSEPTLKSGFSFGSAAGGSTSSSGFSFGSGSGSFSAPATQKDEEKGSEESKEGSAAPSEAASEGMMSAFGNKPHDEEGEGEEDEVTTHAIKSKAYRMKKADEKGGPGWVEIGTGILRLKKHKETESRRVLLRNSMTGKINLNFKLYSGLKPSQAKKAVTFVGHDTNGVAQTYTVRVATEEQAVELKAALEREIEFVKAKESA